MPSFRRWVAFLCLSATLGLGSTGLAEPGFGNPYGRPLPVRPVPPMVRPMPPIAGPVPMPPVGGPAIVVPGPSLVLLQQLGLHAKNLTDEIAATNEVMAVNTGGSVIAPPVLARFQMNPYTRMLIDTNLSFIPPRPASPVAQARSVEYMVAWRMADVLQAVDFMIANPNPMNMQLLINRFSIAVPSTYLYIEGMRETFMISPVMQWPNAELPAILCRLEAQILVMRQLMDALYCNATFHPFFPRSWGFIEPTFAAYRIDVRAPGPVGIAPFPFFQDGPRGPGGFFTPNVAPVPRQGLNPALPYDPSAWNGNFDRFDTRYVDGNPLPQNPGMVPGVQSALPGAGALPAQGNPGVGGVPLQQGGGIQQGGFPGAGGLPPQQGGGQQYGPAYGGQQGQGQPLPGGNGNGFDQNGVAGFQGQGQGGQPQQYGPAYGDPNQQQGQGYGQPQQGNQPQRPRMDQNGQPLQSGNTNGVQWGDFSYDQNSQSNGQQQQQPNNGQYQQQPQYQYQQPQYQQQSNGQYQQQYRGQYPQQQQNQLPPEQYPAPRQ